MVASIDYTWPAYLDEIQKPGKWVNNCSADPDEAWTGTKNYAAAVALAKNGWTEGRAMMARGLSALTPATGRHASRRLDVAGAYPIAAMAAAGDMECMVYMGEEIAPRPVVKIVCSIGASASVPTAIIINRGIALCSIIDAIENTGQRVELVAACTGGPMRSATPFLFNVTVKEAGEPLEIDRVAFAFAHPSSLRRCSFRLMEIHLPESDWGVDYGKPRLLDQADYGDAIIFQTLMAQADYATPAKALETVAKGVLAAGVEITSHA